MSDEVEMTVGKSIAMMTKAAGNEAMVSRYLLSAVV